MATKENSGSLNENDKGDNPKRPDMRGSLDVEGMPYWISAWRRSGPRGDFLSLAVQRKDSDAGGGRSPKPAPVDETDDGIPF